MTPTVERARHRWREILPLLGVAPRFLVRRHGPCPLCGGKDRFRFDDRDGRGSYYCGQCGPGDGIIMVRKKNGWDFKTAADEIDRILGNLAYQAAAIGKPSNPQRDDEGRARDIRRLLQEARSPDVVTAYLKRRGLTVTSPILRGHWQCPYYEDGQHVGTYRAVVAPIQAPDGRLVSAQRIYDAPNLASRKKMMPPVGTVTGGAVRLFDIIDGRLGVAEGVETALAAYQMKGFPMWASLSAHGLETFEPPPEAEIVYIFADNDANFVGQSAAHNLAKRLHKAGFAIGGILTPPKQGTDCLDFLNGARS